MASTAGTLWDQLPLRRTRAAPEPDARPRAVALPTAWDDSAAAALAALAPGGGPVSLPAAAEPWIRRIATRGRRLGRLDSAGAAAAFAESLRALLLARRGAPGAGVWRNDGAAEPRFVLNLPAFLDEEGGFDAPAYRAAVAVAVRALDILGGGKAGRLNLGFADLAGLLAGIGLRYDSPEARAVGAAIGALTRGAAEAESGRLAERHGATEPVALFAPPPPASTVVPGLAEAARAALDEAAAAPGRRHVALVALQPADAVEALLGAETGGLSPAPGPTRPGFDLLGRPADLPTAAARRAGTRAAALLAQVNEPARRAMAEATGRFLHADPPAPAALAEPGRPAPRPAPRRQTGGGRGANWCVTVGGHRVALHTSEDAEGRPIGISFQLSKESAAYRSLMDAFALAVSLGLQSGVPLDEYVESYGYTRFGPSGAVEGDPAITRATSVLDWAFRRLAIDYLGRRDLPNPSEADCAMDAIGNAAQESMLPLDLPQQPSPRARRRALRLVG
ncbi:TSCPD domain-containing protein [Roseomonas sp. NAR14]|uniref:ribonucleoside-diphosphate reductase n=1 Tax=Roseomonas acroporae TaxID=2937791 RepID=A0A9X1Y5J4_9PROT|nr:TSCPD domain-containing protein [Roseomonas acroporae]MCK8783891.1 TSCPD domain-containing protein [Roseomonas acroporae]